MVHRVNSMHSSPAHHRFAAIPHCPFLHCPQDTSAPLVAAAWLCRRHHYRSQCARVSSAVTSLRPTDSCPLQKWFTLRKSNTNQVTNTWIRLHIARHRWECHHTLRFNHCTRFAALSRLKRIRPFAALRASAFAFLSIRCGARLSADVFRLKQAHFPFTNALIIRRWLLHFRSSRSGFIRQRSIFAGASAACGHYTSEMVQFVHVPSQSQCPVFQIDTNLKSPTSLLVPKLSFP